jgi:hypothetical protein
MGKSDDRSDLSNSCILKAGCDFSTGHRKMTFVGLNGNRTESNTTMESRDRSSVHPPPKHTEEHNETVPGKTKKYMVTG